MTVIESGWRRLIRRHPYFPAAAMMAIWLAQLASWATWEARRQPVGGGIGPEAVPVIPVHFEPPPAFEIERDIPRSPFTSSNPRVAELGLGWAGMPAVESAPAPETQATEDAPAPPPEEFIHERMPPESEEPSREGAEAPPQEMVGPPPPPPEDRAARLQAMRYRGLMRTGDGRRIAFVEDMALGTTLQMQMGEALGIWRLDSIARDSVVFVAEGAEPFEIPRIPPEPDPFEPSLAEPPSTAETVPAPHPEAAPAAEPPPAGQPAETPAAPPAEAPAAAPSPPPAAPEEGTEETAA